MGLDPVAVDKIGTVMINQERAAHSLGSLDPSHIHVASLAPYSLGTDDPAQIELIEIDAAAQTGVGDEAPAAGGAALLAPYPNPSRGGCTIRFRCGTGTGPEIVIADAEGSLVRRIPTERHAPGLNSYPWDGRDERGRSVPAGVYFCRLTTREGSQRQRVVLVR